MKSKSLCLEETMRLVRKAKEFKGRISMTYKLENTGSLHRPCVVLAAMHCFGVLCMLFHLIFTPTLWVMIAFIPTLRKRKLRHKAYNLLKVTQLMVDLRIQNQEFCLHTLLLKYSIIINYSGKGERKLVPKIKF